MLAGTLITSSIIDVIREILNYKFIKIFIESLSYLMEYNLKKKIIYNKINLKKKNKFYNPICVLI